MIEIVSRPIKDLCNFNALNPIVYTLRREDFQFNQINDNGGFAQIQINSTDVSADFEVDDEVYIEGLGAATVTASAFSTHTLITVDLAFTATSTGFINNLSKRTDHKIEVEVFDYETDESLGPRIVVDAAENGEVKCDISGILRAYLYSDWQEVALNEVEEFTSKKVYIEVQEFYDSTYWTADSDVLNPIIAVFGFIPLLLNPPPNFTRYAHGGNLLSFFPEDDERMFLRRFSRPSVWRGYPFSLSFCWPSSISSIDRRVKQYDSEGNELSNTTEALDSSSSGPFITDRVHRLSVGTIDPDAVELKISLESSSVQITEELTLKVKDPCENPVYLFWKNTLGGDAFWMFDESQEYEHTYPSGRKVKRLTLFADNLTVDEWDAINELNSPSEVIASNIIDYELSNTIDKTHFRNDNQLYIINEDAERVGVIVVPSGSETKTSFRKHAIQVTIELPEFFAV